MHSYEHSTNHCFNQSGNAQTFRLYTVNDQLGITIFADQEVVYSTKNGSYDSRYGNIYFSDNQKLITIPASCQGDVHFVPKYTLTFHMEQIGIDGSPQRLATGQMIMSDIFRAINSSIALLLYDEIDLEKWGWLFIYAQDDCNNVMDDGPNDLHSSDTAESASESEC